MSNSSNAVALALLAILESQARKKGRKSLAKRVAHRLRKSGAAESLVSDVEALCAKPTPPANKEAARTPSGKAKTKPAKAPLLV